MSAQRSADASASPPILPALLELYRRGKPPFLVRNLRYVHVDRHRARRRLWDLSWTRPSYRSAAGARHLLLTVRPSRCVLRAGTRHRLFAARPAAHGDYVPLVATLRLCLCVRQEGGHYVSFSLRDLSLRVWPAEDLAARLVEPQDVAVRETFDISAVLPVLSSQAEALSLVVELEPSKRQLARPRCDKLRGELVLWEKQSANGTVVPNGFVTLPLYLVNDNAIQPKQVVLERAVRQASASIASWNNSASFVGAGAASIVLQLVGAPQHAISNALHQHRPNLMIKLTYTSQQVPQWDGIVRHDFVCPWCHRNCYRYRTLLSHFQMEHEQMKFQLTSLKSPAPFTPENADSEAAKANQSFPFLVSFSVETLQPHPGTADPLPSSVAKRMRSGNAPASLPEQLIYANPQRYGSYASTAGNRARADEQVREAMERVSLKDSAAPSDAPSVASTELYDNTRRDLLSTVEEELRTCCKHCQRPHDFTYEANTRFCSEWCEAVYTVNRDEDGVSLRGNKSLIPLSSYSSGNSRKRFDFRRSLGHRKLFHVVSMTPVKEEHYDEDDPDSEDEVDQSWRGRLAIERAMYLEDTTTTETLFMVMWNKFAHENFPLPSHYGDRFTRYTLELFAIENRTHIIRLKLRLQFLAFLRVLHMHGLIDSVAVLSIFQCLDGKKKRRDIALSSRPERSVAGSNGRGNRGRRSISRV